MKIGDTVTFNEVPVDFHCGENEWPVNGILTEENENHIVVRVNSDTFVTFERDGDSCLSWDCSGDWKIER